MKAIPEPPPRLEGAAAEIWREVAPRISGLYLARVETVARYCEILALYRAAMEIASRGAIGDDLSANPGYGEVAKLAGPLLQLEKALRLA